MSFESIYDASYDRVLSPRQEGEEFFTAFYRHFLAASPLVREKFATTDMDRQRSMLKKSFYRLIVFYATNAEDHYLNKIAVLHDANHLDIAPELYDIWLESLIATVSEFDPEFSDEVELAWRLVLSSGITYMKFHYRR